MSGFLMAHQHIEGQMCLLLLNWNKKSLTVMKRRL